MKKENILRAVRIIVLVIFCLFAAKVFIGKNGKNIRKLKKIFGDIVVKEM